MIYYTLSILYCHLIREPHKTITNEKINHIYTLTHLQIYRITPPAVRIFFTCQHPRRSFSLFIPLFRLIRFSMYCISVPLLHFSMILIQSEIKAVDDAVDAVFECSMLDKGQLNLNATTFCMKRKHRVRRSGNILKLKFFFP